jgi:molybdate transport system regulatory protein
MAQGFSAHLTLGFAGGEISARRLALLDAVDRTGSISGAARDCGVTYKAAWDAVDAMNNLAPQPMVVARHGGAHGGGADVTDYGRRVLAGLHQLHDVLGKVFAELTTDPHDALQFIRSLRMRTSARNALHGVVESIRHDNVECEVSLRLQGDDRLHAVITRASADALQLVPGTEVTALIKASWLLLAAEGEGLRTSARNRLCGVIEAIEAGQVNAEIRLRLDGGNSLVAVITAASLASLGFQVGQRVCALVKASHVVLAVNA